MYQVLQLIRTRILFLFKSSIDENNLDLDIEVDGGINDKTAKDVIESGANILVAGSYILNSENPKEAIKLLKGENK